MNIIAVDWGKETRKRSAYVFNPTTARISRLRFDGHLASLYAFASQLKGPVLIGIDAAIGFPAIPWERLLRVISTRPSTFADCLLDGCLPDRFFEAAACPADWSPQRPFIRPPRGKWSLHAFIEASRDGLHRKVDRRLQANPMFVTCGIPGSVGSGTRALWQEIATLEDRNRLRIWPFHGCLTHLMQEETSDSPVIAEIYPKACYGIALAATLPTPLLPLAKTRTQVRHQVIKRLRESDWLAREHVRIEDIDAALANEDDFDALLSAAALTRLYLEKAPFDSTDSIDPVAEGGVLGSASLCQRSGKDADLAS